MWYTFNIIINLATCNRYNYFAMVTRCLVFALLFLFVACKGNESDEIESVVLDFDSVNVELDLVDLNEADSQVSEDQSEIDQATKDIEAKYGEQWDFCACIIAQDSIDKAFQKDLSDAQMDRLIDRSDFVDNKCKTLLIQPNSTPEERDKHEKKVKNCLRNAKKK